MSEFIKKLKDQDKLSLSIDKNRDARIKLGDILIGGKEKTIIAGPCSVESKESLMDFAKVLKQRGVHAMRAGAFKPTTFPIKKAVGEWKEGLREKALPYLKEAGESSGLPIVTEIMDARHIPMVSSVADVLQVGTRNFQNYTLLDELGKIDKPILLKRGTWATIDEILGAVERIMYGGNTKVMICLRGVVGMPSYRHVFPSIRWAPDLMMIPALKEFTNIPIIYDPSHSTGYRKFVVPISKAALAVGADGLIIEVHPTPEKSISDVDQAAGLEELDEIMNFAKNIAKI